jgi:hypothetical protein
MKNLYEPSTVADLKQRIAQLTPEHPPQWGRMNAAQAAAHCAASMEWAVGDSKPKRAFVGRIFAPLVRPKLLGTDEPMRRNAPTSKELIVADQRDLSKECQRLAGLIDRFATAGPAGCTTHPHTFFGQMTPEQWAILTYKHLDHHLRQFGV